MGFPPGDVTTGRAAIRGVFEELLRHVPRFEPEEPLPTLELDGVALTATLPKDDAGARAQVARRRPDGSWLRTLDRPEIA